MNISNNKVGGSLAKSAQPVGLATPEINNPKRATVQQVENGFVISLQNVDSYGERNKISKTLDEVGVLLTEYFD